MSRTSVPVLRAMSESVVLRQLPPGTIIFEECTRAESEFVVLAGTVEVGGRAGGTWTELHGTALCIP